MQNEALKCVHKNCKALQTADGEYCNKHYPKAIRQDKTDEREIDHDIMIETAVKDLNTAKKNVLWLLDNPDGLIDWHGIEYWAGRVERLREIIKKSL